VIKIPKPTKEDASLLVQIFGVANADEKYRKAQNWFVYEMNEKNYDDFKKKYPIGSEGYTNFMNITSYAELIGTLVNSEVLSEDLVFEMWANMMWDKAKPIVYGLRKDLAMPRFMENYEACVKKYPEWEKKNPIKI
jgi:hypothetical protein